MKVDGKNALAGLLLVVLIISTPTDSSSDCCDFEPVTPITCVWNTIDFLTAPADGTPKTDMYPGFYPTPDLYYLYLQDASGTTSSVNEFFVADPTTTFRWDYFYNSPSGAPDAYLHVYAYNKVIKTLIGSHTVSQNTWLSVNVVCNNAVQYCCGSLGDIPCSVTLEIVASLGSTGTTGLFAIDNIGTCSSLPVTTTTAAITTPTTTTATITTRPTLPPPVPPTSGCCDFNTNTCGMSGSNWYWSVYLMPSLPIPPIDYNYLWTDQLGATLYTSPISRVQTGTTFTIEFYASSPDVQLNFYFLPTFGGSNLLETVNGVTGYWTSETQTCIGCCSPQPELCEGRIMVEVISAPITFVAAIDNAEINSACHDALPCCYFDDPDTCTFTNPGDGGYFWQWSVSNPSINIVPYPGTPYEYFEITPSPNPTALTAILRSPLISIKDVQEFEGHFYVKTPQGLSGADQMQINFREEISTSVAELNVLKDTSGVWTLMTLQCSSGQCCSSPSGCSGFIEITAIVAALSDPLIFAIDSFQVGTACSPFPGASNSTLVHFSHLSTK